MKSVAGSGLNSCWTPWVTDRAAPATNRRGEQGPHVRFAPVPEWMRTVRWSARAPVGDEEEHLVAGVGPRVRGLRHDGGRPGDQRRPGLRERDEGVGAKGDDDSPRAGGRAGTRG